MRFCEIWHTSTPCNDTVGPYTFVTLKDPEPNVQGISSSILRPYVTLNGSYGYDYELNKWFLVVT